ncbi:MAG: thioredoxin domain-containing protein [Deltaproteobacteria bacterium]|nr:thioredoxin domain-containing protein [Deltaproteobacteria bacterium]
MTGSIEKLVDNYNIKINYKAHPLRKDIPDEGMSLEEYMGGRMLDLEQIKLNFKKMATDNGLPASDLSIISNSRYAHELAVWAEEKGKGDIFHRETYLAYFGEGKNIADIEVLKQLATKSGLSSNEAEKVILTRKYRDHIDRNWDESEKRELVAAPTFFIGEERLVGAHPYERLLRFITDNGAVKRI